MTLPSVKEPGDDLDGISPQGIIVVNGKTYQKLGTIGKGGSSKVSALGSTLLTEIVEIQELFICVLVMFLIRIFRIKDSTDFYDF